MVRSIPHLFHLLPLHEQTLYPCALTAFLNCNYQKAWTSRLREYTTLAVLLVLIVVDFPVFGYQLHEPASPSISKLYRISSVSSRF